MDDNTTTTTLQSIQISGPTLASLLHRISSSSSSGDIDGLLFGHVTHLVPSTLSDAPTTSDHPPPLIATVTSFFSSTSSSTFYSPSGHLHAPSLALLCSSPLTHSPSRAALPSPPDHILGWFSSRRKTHLRPSMREASVAANLAANFNQEKNQENQENEKNGVFFGPNVFILFTTPFHDQLIHTHEYKAFQYHPSTEFFEAKTLNVVNLGPAFRGHYGNFTARSPFPEMLCEVKGLDNGCMVEDEEGKDDGESEKLGLMCDEGFEIGRLKSLMGPEAAGYTAELEALYDGMIKKMNGLAKLVEQSSARVLEQENINMKLRYKVAGFE